MFLVPASPMELKMLSVTSRMRSVASPCRPIGCPPLAYCLICCSSSLRAWVTPVAATPTCLSSCSSLVAPCDASTQPSTDLATSFPASMSCSWHTGELMVGATTWNTDKTHTHEHQLRSESPSVYESGVNAHSCAGHQLGRGQGALGGGSNHSVLLSWIFCFLSHILGL